jgi:hypothetical protein
MATEALVEPTLARTAGSLKIYRAPGVRRIIVFSGSEVPASHFVPSNWNREDAARQRGNSRQVRFITKLVDGTRSDAVVKGTESWFVGSAKRLRQGHFFVHEWRHDPVIHVEDPRVLRILAFGEARALHLIGERGVAAERPQALIVHNDGSVQMVTRKLAKREGAAWKKLWLPDILKIRRQVKAAGFKPRDVMPHNVIVNDRDQLALVDASRIMPKRHQTRLINALLKKLEKQGPTTPHDDRPKRPFSQRFFRFGA